MIAKYLWEIGSVIIGFMGLTHMYGTLFSNKIQPRNKSLIDEMKTSTLLLTDKLSMWKSWIGFNATHSLGAAFIGIVNFYLAIKYFVFLMSDQLLLLITIAAVGFYVWVANKYWFKVAFVLLLFALLCFITSYILIMSKQG